MRAFQPEHTPGPWSLRESNPPKLTRLTVVRASDDSDEDIYIADCPPEDNDGYQWAANARLIAAAPDLLAALIVADAALRHHPEGDDRSTEDRQQAARAIDKALGVSSQRQAFEQRFGGLFEQVTK